LCGTFFRYSRRCRSSEPGAVLCLRRGRRPGSGQHQWSCLLHSHGGGFAPVENAGGWGGSGTALSATPGVEGNLWLAFRANGLYHSTNAGATFTKLDTAQESYSLGFGKPAPGKKYPVLFLAGKVGNLQALFRSDNAGESWVRINDDQHQYGGINHVTGDPRIYGRVYLALAVAA